jgi:hypothetical protein
MAVLKIQNFGGLKPRAAARALPADAAQTATNLQANTGEFRPLAQDTTVVAASGVNNPVFLFRFQRNADGTLNTNFSDAGRWVVSATDVSYAKYQVNDDTTDKHCYTFNDGSAAPRVRDALGNDRQLGVPAPTTKPTVSLNVVDEFTTADRAAELQAALQTAVDAVRVNATPSWVGCTRPGTGTTGYGDQTAANGFGIPDEARMARVYRLTGSGGTISDDYTSLDASMFTWIFDPQLGGFQGQAIASSPAWAGGTGTWHYCLTFLAYGRAYTLNTAAISTALTAIAMPGKTDGTKLLSAGQVSDIVADLSDLVDPAGTTLKPKIDSVKQAFEQLKALLDGGAQASLAAQTTAFYSKTDVANAITAAKANFAESVFNAASGIVRSSLAADYFASPGDSA